MKVENVSRPTCRFLSPPALTDPDAFAPFTPSFPPSPFFNGPSSTIRNIPSVFIIFGDGALEVEVGWEAIACTCGG